MSERMDKIKAQFPDGVIPAGTSMSSADLKEIFPMPDSTCGHPKECLDSDDDCRWCMELEALRHTVKALKDECLGHLSVQNYSGDVTVTGSVGLIECFGGTINYTPKDAGALDKITTIGKDFSMC